MDKGVNTGRYKVGREACTGVGATYIVFGLHQIQILQRLYQLLVDDLSKDDIMEGKKKVLANIVNYLIQESCTENRLKSMKALDRK